MLSPLLSVAAIGAASAVAFLWPVSSGALRDACNCSMTQTWNAVSGPKTCTVGPASCIDLTVLNFTAKVDGKCLAGEFCTTPLKCYPTKQQIQATYTTNCPVFDCCPDDAGGVSQDGVPLDPAFARGGPPVNFILGGGFTTCNFWYLTGVQITCLTGGANLYSRFQWWDCAQCLALAGD